jgi:hypothetical protein
VNSLEGWLPIGFEWTAQRPTVDWCYLGGMRFTDPFFENTMQRVMWQPFRLLFRQKTPIEVLETRAETHPGIDPTGFIFHMSRCGSTLITQMLAASEENVVISEGWPIEAAINADIRHPGVTHEQRALWLRAVIRALGQPRLGNERRYFVKFDAPHVMDLPLVSSLFPHVPWVFVYRDPVEVMVSQLNERAGWTMPGTAAVRGVPFTAEAFTNQEEYVGKLMACMCESALTGENPKGMLLNYRELPDALLGELGAHFGCTWTGEEAARMRETSRGDAKRRGKVFKPDSQSKQREADDFLREICDRLVGGVYARLEERRRERRPGL